MKKILLTIITCLILLSDITPVQASDKPVEMTYDQLKYSVPLQYIKWLGFGLDYLDQSGHLFQWGKTQAERYMNSGLSAKKEWASDIQTRSDKGKLIKYGDSETSPIPLTRAELWERGTSNCSDFIGIFVNDYLNHAGIKNESIWTYSKWHSVYRIYTTLSELAEKNDGVTELLYKNYSLKASGCIEALDMDGLLPGDIILCNSKYGYSGWVDAHAYIYAGYYNGMHIGVDCVGGSDGRGIQINNLSAYLGDPAFVSSGASEGYAIKAIYRLDRGSLQIEKYIKTNKDLCDIAGISTEGAVFEVYNSYGIPVATVETGADGKTPVIENLFPGTYTVKEVKAPEGLLLPEDEDAEKIIEVKVGETATLQYGDEAAFDPITVFLNKKNAKTEIPVPDAEFTVNVYLGKEKK